MGTLVRNFFNLYIAGGGRCCYASSCSSNALLRHVVSSLNLPSSSRTFFYSDYDINTHSLAVHGSVTQRSQFVCLYLERDYSSWRNIASSAIKVRLEHPRTRHLVVCARLVHVYRLLSMLIIRYRHRDCALPPRPTAAVQHCLAANLPLPLLCARALCHRLLAPVFHGLRMDACG